MTNKTPQLNLSSTKHTARIRNKLCRELRNEFTTSIYHAKHDKDYERKANNKLSMIRYDDRYLYTWPEIYRQNVGYIIRAVDNHIFTRKQAIEAVSYLILNQNIIGVDNYYIRIYFGLIYYILKLAPYVTSDEIIAVFNTASVEKNIYALKKIVDRDNEPLIMYNIFGRSVTDSVIEYCNALKFAKELQ